MTLRVTVEGLLRVGGVLLESGTKGWFKSNPQATRF